MVVNVTPEMIAKFEAQRKQKIADYQKITEQLKQEKLEREAFYQQKKDNLDTVTTLKEHQCVECGAVIPAGMQVKRAIQKCVYGTNWGFETVYYCNACRPNEVKKE